MDAATLNLILIIILMGIAVGAINRILPMAVSFKHLLNFFAMLLCCFYILEFLGIISPLLPIPRILH